MNTQTETPRMAVTITGELPEATVKEYEAEAARIRAHGVDVTADDIMVMAVYWYYDNILEPASEEEKQTGAEVVALRFLAERQGG